MNSHMPFKFLTYSVPWLKEDLLTSLHKNVSTIPINDVNDEP